MSIRIFHDPALVAEIAARFDLRDPNRDALDTIVHHVADRPHDGETFPELIADLATGVGKTYLMSSLIEYLATQGVRHVLVVTPGSTIQTKTLANFDAASAKYVSGADIEPFIITPENFRTANVAAVLRDPNRLKVFVFNVQQLIRPTDNMSRRTRQEDENLGDALYAQLETADDLFVIADEHHIYREKAKAFSAAIRDLNPQALIGLTATPDQADAAKVIFQYTLGEAIADGHVKIPVIVYRKDGTKDERSQLSDACKLLRHKEVSYNTYRQVNPDAAAVKPVLFVVCQTIEHASEVGQLLAGPDMIGEDGQVLEITSQSSDEALTALAEVESSDSPVRAIVSVNMLREGWDVKNIAVIVALRRLASQTLTEQILGRGLRLPFGQRTGLPDVDQVDLVAHDSYQQLLAQKDVLRQRVQTASSAQEVDQTGAAPPVPIPPINPGTTTPQSSLGQLTPAAPASSGQQTLTDFGGTTHTGDADDDTVGDVLLQETEDRIETPQPEPRNRVAGAPQIIFPRRESRLVHAAFSLADVPDGDAEAAGARFIKEIPTFLFRDALEASRTSAGIAIEATPQKEQEAQQEVTGLDTVRIELEEAIMRQPEVPAERASRNASKRLVRAFLKGAGVVSDEVTVEWGQRRRETAVEGMRQMIRARIAERRMQASFELVPVELPIEPVMVAPSPPPAHSETGFVKQVQYGGWARNIMPVAAFDARTTEWDLARLLDRDSSIQWWLRIYNDGPAFIPTTDGRYFPDFIVIDDEGVNWLVETKADNRAADAGVQLKKRAAETWARAVRDDGRYGTWRYLFATEADIKQAAGSWRSLLVTTNPE